MSDELHIINSGATYAPAGWRSPNPSGFSCSETTAKLDAALAKAQGAIQAAAKGKENDFFQSKYADLAAVWAACREALSSNGISITQWPVHDEGDRLHIVTRLAYSGEWIMARWSVPVGKKDAQGYVASTTYARRAALAAAVGVAPDDDDDGETAVGRNNTTAKAAPKKATPPKQDPAVWANGFINKMRGAQSIEDLNGLWEGAKKPIEKLEAEHPDQYDLVGQAYDQCRAAIEAAESTTQAAE